MRDSAAGRPGMVVVGGGEAGARAAVALRENGYDGAVTLIGEEPHHPYERPPLSKVVMTSAGEPVPATILTKERLDDHRIAHLPGARAVGLDIAAKTVRIEGGRDLPYERLLLATGARPRRLLFDGTEPNGTILYLRNWPDALTLRGALVPGARIVVIGGGFIGLELAASAVERGASVTLVEAAPRILMRGVPASIAALVAARHAQAGVDIRVGIGIAGIAAAEGATIVRLVDGSLIEADAVIVGIGAVPDTGLAEAAGLAIENGIRVDETLETSEPGIFAAGDCCSFPHPLYDGRRLRLEAWRNAQEQGSLAARNMLGSGESHATVPWFWSDQYDLCLQIAGLADGAATTIERASSDEAKFLFHLDETGRLIAASAFGPIGTVAKDIRLAEMLIERRARPDPAMLAAPGLKLKAMLAALPVAPA